MRHGSTTPEVRLLPLGATVLLGFACVASIFIVPDAAFAADGRNKADRRVTAQAAGQAAGGTQAAQNVAPGSNGAACSCPANSGPNPGPNPGPNNTPAAGQGAGQPPSSHPEHAPSQERLWPKPSFADLSRPVLDETDAVAAIEAVHVGLSEVPDGGTYVWHRGHGRLSGSVMPTQSFKDRNGQVCRHVVVSMSTMTNHRRVEGIACRQDNGVWSLAG